jgi:hypothetical protein
MAGAYGMAGAGHHWVSAHWQLPKGITVVVLVLSAAVFAAIQTGI